jgi:hypothetical protein
MAAQTCPHCKMPVRDDDALLCLYCGENLGRSVGFMGRLKYTRPRILVVIAVGIILVSFLLLFIR